MASAFFDALMSGWVTAGNDKMPRLISCSRCGKIHPINACAVPVAHRRWESHSAESKFRSSYKWTKKSEQIRERDNYLCQACLHNLDGKGVRYTSEALEVHHIRSLSDDFESKLDDENLVTLCREHHEQAEAGKLGSDVLHELVKSKYQGGVRS